MSDSVLRLVPRNPSYQPTRDEAARAEALLGKLIPDSDQISSTFLDSVNFIDAGQNWSGVECLLCDSDLADWWSSAMSSAAETQFKNLLVDLPCCNRSVSLNDLNYGWTVAFGSWLLEARNPNRNGLEADEIDALSKLVGEPLTQILARV